MIFSSVTESGVYTTIPMPKVYAVLSGLSNSERAFLCRGKPNARRLIEDHMINVLNDQMIQIIYNHKFWTFRDAYESKKASFMGSPLQLSG